MTRLQRRREWEEYFKNFEAKPYSKKERQELLKDMEDIPDLPYKIPIIKVIAVRAVNVIERYEATIELLENRIRELEENNVS